MVGPPRTRLSCGRRSILRGVGAGAVGWAAFTASSDRATADEHDGDEPDGMLVLIYDDSPRTDYTEAFPVHQEYDVPGCVAACPGLMGEHSKWMHPGHLQEMHEAGWEVMSHSLEHRPLGEIPVRGDIEEGDTEIIVQSNEQGSHPGDPIVISDGDSETTATVAGRDSNGSEDLLLLEEPIDESFDAGDGWATYVSYPPEFIDDILEESRAQLEEWGFGPVTSYVHPFNRSDGYVREAVREFYDAVPNRHGGGLNPAFEPDPFTLGRRNFEEGRMSESELADFLDTVANDPDFGILYGHTHRSELTQERIETVIQLAQERNVEIVTLQTALARLEDTGNGTGNPGTDDTPPDDTPPTNPDDGTDDPGPLRGRIESVRRRLEGAIRDLLGALGSLLP